MFNINSDVKFVLDTLKSRGYEAYIVGGAIRDYIMGVAPADFDVTTSARPQEILDAFADKRTFTEGIAHGTVGVRVGGTVVEITPFRVDGVYSDNRHPENVSFNATLNDDLCRRDFTVNAIAFDGADFIDPHGGREDIEKGIIKTVGDPYKRFNEDALRIMRALRFSSVLGFEIEDKTRLAIFESSHLLKNISKERITAELFKLLCGKNAENVIMEYSAVLDIFINGVHKMYGFDHRNRYHMYDVLTHTAKTVTLCPPEPIIRLSALLHDIGKPVCCQEEESGYRHFKGHPSVSLEITKEATKNLSLSNAERKMLLFLVEFHDEIVKPTRPNVKRWLAKYGEEAMRALCALKFADASTHNTAATDRVIIANELKALVENIISSGECYTLSTLKIDGKDLIALGIQGEKIGKVLDRLLNLVIDEKCENEKNALLSRARALTC